MRASPRNVTRRPQRRGVRVTAALAFAVLLGSVVAIAPARAAGEAPSPGKSSVRDTAAKAAATRRPAASARVAVPAGAATVAKPAAKQATQAPAKSPAVTRPSDAKPAPAAKAPAATPAPPSASSLAGRAAAPKQGAAPGAKPAVPAPAKVGAAATAKTAASAPKVTTVKTGERPAVRNKPVIRPTSVEERVTYQYNALGRRDPFQALVGGGFVEADVASAPPDVGGLTLVGVVWGADDRFALVEDARGNSLVLRKGDRVMNGVVEGLRRDALVVKLTVDGSTDIVEIPLTRKGDDPNANR